MSQRKSTVPGLRFGTPAIPNGTGGTNYSSVSGTVSRLLVGIRATWHVCKQGAFILRLESEMPKTDKDVASSLWMLVGGFLTSAAIIAAIIGGFVYFHSGK
jgi:hypothetical protein